MTYRDFAAVVRRNWVVALVVAVLTLGFAAREVTARPSYQTRTVITLLSPEAAFPRNAYAAFTQSLVLMADVLSRTIDTDDARRAVTGAGGRGNFQVTLYNRGSEQYPIYDEPYLTVVTNARGPAEAVATRRAVLVVLDSQLHQRQTASGANKRSLITWRLTEADAAPVKVIGQPSRELFTTMIAGLILAVFCALLADRHRDVLRGLPRRAYRAVRPGNVSAAR